MLINKSSRMNLHTTYLNGVKSLFKYYRSLAEKSIAQVEPEQIFLRPSENLWQSFRTRISLCKDGKLGGYALNMHWIPFTKKIYKKLFISGMKDTASWMR